MYSSYSINGDFSFRNIRENFVGEGENNTVVTKSYTTADVDRAADKAAADEASNFKASADAASNFKASNYNGLTSDIIELELQDVVNKEYGQAKEYYGKLTSLYNNVLSYIKDIDIFYANISDLNSNNNIVSSNLYNLTSAVNSINILFNYSDLINYIINNIILNINNSYTTAKNNLLILGKTLDPQTLNLVTVNNILTEVTPIMKSINDMKIYANNKLASASTLYNARINSKCSPGYFSVTDTKCCLDNTLYYYNSCNSCPENYYYDSINNICNIKPDYLTTSSRITTPIDSKRASKSVSGTNITYSCNNTLYPTLSSNRCYSTTCPGCTTSDCQNYVMSDNTCIACPPGYSYDTNKSKCNLINTTTLPTKSSFINKSGL